MANAPAQAFGEPLEALFGGGTCAGLSDGQLLERFLAGRNEAGELAFETLVSRHGPAVLRVCRGVLRDPNDVHDAFPAVFLVLARRAGAIRRRASLGSWLYGVAVRVAARARVAVVRRSIRDRRTAQAAQAIVAAGPIQDGDSLAERHEGALIIHQEVNRLPERFRAPIVLCYLEGLTHDEAAARLSWPVGTVRSRLFRARGALRDRLNRRGLTAPAALGLLSQSTVGEHVAGDGSGPDASLSPSQLPRELAAAVARAASAVAAGDSPAGVSITATSLSLAQGVLKTMTLKKLLFAALTVLPLGMIATSGGAFLAGKTHGQDPRTAEAAPPRTVKQADPREESKALANLELLEQQLLEAARKRYETQKAHYEGGRIALDRFADASKQLALAELRTATTAGERTSIRQRHIDRLKDLEKRAQADVDLGTGSIANVSEVSYRRLEAEIDLKLSQKPEGEMASMLSRLSTLEKKVQELQNARGGQPTHRP